MGSPSPALLPMKRETPQLLPYPIPIPATLLFNLKPYLFISIHISYQLRSGGYRFHQDPNANRRVNYHSLYLTTQFTYQKLAPIKNCICTQPQYYIRTLPILFFSVSQYPALFLLHRPHSLFLSIRLQLPLSRCYRPACLIFELINNTLSYRPPLMPQVARRIRRFTLNFPNGNLAIASSMLAKTLHLTPSSLNTQKFGISSEFDGSFMQNSYKNIDSTPANYLRVFELYYQSQNQENNGVSRCEEQMKFSYFYFFDSSWILRSSTNFLFQNWHLLIFFIFLFIALGIQTLIELISILFYTPAYLQYFRYFNIMVPKRKISKGFRQRKVPNIELDTYCKALGDLENMAPYIPQSHNTMQNQMTRETSRKQQIEKFRCLKEKIQKNNLTDIINTGAVKLVKTKMQPEQKKDCFLTNQKQPSQPNRKIISKNRTMQSEDNSLEKFVKVRADELNSSNKKTDLANQILKSIEASINSTCRSMSAMSKDKGKKRRMIDECKVVKVPWKSNKRQFKPEVSMIKKNSSRAPMDSLRQIYQNLN